MAQAQPQGGHFHAVRFYEDDNSLCRIVSDFIGEGIHAGQPAIIISTAAHRECILQNLTAAGHDVDALQQTTDLLLLDARETLKSFMEDDGMPNTERFTAAATTALTRVARGQKTTIRAYGEMVDLLWKDGMSAASIRLEMLWNRLANTHDFSMLCGYAMGNLYKDATIEDVCRHHTHVVSATGEAAAVVS